ncbi:ankyrin repeat domain-containing protein [Flavobacterium sp. S87F.05.LMB.W.Kidney.N]|uniref:ankyrin repeat domain-containing protein n=1 Tax=Flavobacterium sp. S87F.05.LMB.W.Kidney.N TaxID=1278758 RepID=UPI001065AE49|nr:ankyrin repeat domain-containing protein [Flavobacterium sp. S87F.05.LMB.W.Kidney.N]TDX09069.1 ankyrin repeat protein [Flavobacterium sp. S87F.05.LMB.W.Kidney.N]
MGTFDDTQLYKLLFEKDFSKINEFLEKFGLDSVDREGRTFLMSAVIDGNEEMVKDLLILGCGINNQDSKGLTALHLAAINDKVDALKVLLSFNADVNIVDDSGNSALWRAAMELESDSEIIKVLLEKGSDINLENKHGVSPKDLLE